MSVGRSRVARDRGVSPFRARGLHGKKRRREKEMERLIINGTKTECKKRN